MKSVLLILAITATRAVAFEQIFAINAGGPDHTDSDGIVYKNKNISNIFKFGSQIKLDKVPAFDRPIYQWVDYTYVDKPFLKYDIPLKSDGLYVLIEKMTVFGAPKRDVMDMTLNEVQLLSNTDQNLQCGDGGAYNPCDDFFYFCVANNILYYQNQSTPIRNGEIHIEIRPVKGYPQIAGLVLLKGTIGERKKLIGSATQEPMHFDPAKMDPRCAVPEEQSQKSIKTETKTKTDINSVQEAVESQQEQQSEVLDEFQNFSPHFGGLNSYYNMYMNALMQSSLQDQHMGIQRQQSETFDRFENSDQQNTRSDSSDRTASLPAQQECTPHQSIEQVALKLEKLQTELTYQARKTENTNSMLLAGLQKLGTDSQAMQIGIQQMFMSMTLEFQAGQASLRELIFELSRQLNNRDPMQLLFGKLGANSDIGKE